MIMLVICSSMKLVNGSAHIQEEGIIPDSKY